MNLYSRKMATLSTFSFEHEMKRNPKLKREDIQILRSWCDEQLHFPKICDSNLALFLHASYYCLESTQTRINNYYSMRTCVPEFFSDRDPAYSEELKKAFNTV